MARGFVCSCGAISKTRSCPKCARAQAVAQATYDAAKNAASYYRTDHWRRLAAACKLRDGGRCVACSSTDRVVAHHIEPRERVPHPTPADRIGNLVTLCFSHHSQLEADRRAGRDDTDLIRLTRVLAY